MRPDARIVRESPTTARHVQAAYQKALRALQTTISGKTRAAPKGPTDLSWEDQFERLRLYLDRLGMTRDVDALRELCLALGLSGQTGNIDTGLERMTLASSSAGDASRETVEVDISRAKHETLPNASRVLHPAQLRARRKNADPSGEWRAWRAGTPSRDFATDADHDEAASSSVDMGFLFHPDSAGTFDLGRTRVSL